MAGNRRSAELVNSLDKRSGGGNPFLVRIHIPVFLGCIFIHLVKSRFVDLHYLLDRP